MAGSGSAPWNVRRSSHVGYVHGNTPGRADKVPLNVRNNSFVFPADSLASLGQGNAAAGADILNKMFAMGPYGTKPMPSRSGRPHFPHLRPASRRIPTAPQMQFQDGGEVEDGTVPIQASDAEFVVPPEIVAQVGNGSLSAGHAVLHALVLKIRREAIKELRDLEEPRT